MQQHTKFTKQEILEFTEDFFYIIEFGTQQDQNDCLIIVNHLKNRFKMTDEQVIQNIYLLEKMAKS